MHTTKNRKFSPEFTCVLWVFDGKGFSSGAQPNKELHIATHSGLRWKP